MTGSAKDLKTTGGMSVHGVFPAPNKNGERPNIPSLIMKFEALKVECPKAEKEVTELEEENEKAASAQYSIKEHRDLMISALNKSEIMLTKIKKRNALKAEFESVSQQLFSLQQHTDLFAKVCKEIENYLEYLKPKIIEVNKTRNDSKELEESYKLKDSELLDKPEHFRIHHALTKEPMSDEDKTLSELLTKYYLTKEISKLALDLQKSRELSPMKKIKNLEDFLKKKDLVRRAEETYKQILSKPRNSWDPRAPRGATMVTNIEKALADATQIFSVAPPSTACKPG